MSNRFTIIINDDDGEVSLEIQDYSTNTKIALDVDAFKDSEGLNIYELSRIIIGLLKPKFREIVTKPKLGKVAVICSGMGDFHAFMDEQKKCGNFVEGVEYVCLYKPHHAQGLLFNTFLETEESNENPNKEMIRKIVNANIR